MYLQSSHQNLYDIPRETMRPDPPHPVNASVQKKEHCEQALVSKQMGHNADWEIDQVSKRPSKQQYNWGCPQELLAFYASNAKRNVEKEQEAMDAIMFSITRRSEGRWVQTETQDLTRHLLATGALRRKRFVDWWFLYHQKTKECRRWPKVSCSQLSAASNNLYLSMRPDYLPPPYRNWSDYYLQCFYAALIFNEAVLHPKCFFTFAATSMLPGTERSKHYRNMKVFWRRLRQHREWNASILKREREWEQYFRTRYKKFPSLTLSKMPWKIR